MARAHDNRNSLRVTPRVVQGRRCRRGAGAIAQPNQRARAQRGLPLLVATDAGRVDGQLVDPQRLRVREQPGPKVWQHQELVELHLGEVGGAQDDIGSVDHQLAIAPSPHDAVGTNIYAHVLRGRVMRIVPRANDDVNETWIADRDRFSYQGIYSEDRLMKPSIRENGVLQETDWETALQKVAEKLARVAKQHGGGQIGAIASPNSTLEELFLLMRIARGLGEEQ